MENSVTSQVQYTFKEKFFQIEPEGRIRRYQYLVRSLVPSFLVLLGIIPFGLLAGMILMSLGSKVGGIILFLGYAYICFLFYRIALNNSVKRCHDFENDGKLAAKIVQLSFGIGLLGMLITLLGTLGILPTADLVDNLNQLNSLGDNVSVSDITRIMADSQPTYLKILSSIQQIVAVISFILWIFLLFRPGKSGDNQFGKDPINTKVSFLG